MYTVIAISRLTNVVEYVSPPLQNERANELAIALRHHTNLKVSIESPDLETVINAKGETN
jgi:hypothetical protein